MNLGEYIKKLRNEVGLSQRELSERSGVSNAEVSRIETGDRKKPSPKVLKAFAPHLCVPYSELLEKAGYLDEVIDHPGYTENIFRDEDGKLLEVFRRAKSMEEKDSDWASLAYRVSSSNISKEQLDIIKANTKLLLDEFIKNNKK